MITIPGQLAIETRHGRYGDFNVGQLRTSLGVFAVKDPELDQYPQGKYDGDFIVMEIRPQTYSTNGRIVFEIRAYLGGMTLSNIDALTQDDAKNLVAQEPDPIEQEAKTPSAQSLTPETARTLEPAQDLQPVPLTPPIDQTLESAPPAVDDTSPDAQLFGPLWPLSNRFKLDTTIDRRLLRQQCGRLDLLNFDFDPKTQEWFRKAA